MNTFESRLESELVRMVAERAEHTAGAERGASPVRRSGRRGRRVRLAVVGAVAAAALAAPLALGGSGVQPAYAVVRNPDGTLTVTVHDLRSPGGLQKKLQDYGIRARVTVNTVCGVRESAKAYIDPPVAGPETPGNVVTVDPRKLPAGSTLYLAVRTRAGSSGTAEGFSVRLARDGAPVSCTPTSR